MDATAKKLMGLLQANRPAELRAAAIKVLAEVGLHDKKLEEQLCGFLDDTDLTLRRSAMEAVGKLQIQQALPRLLEMAKKGGEHGPLAAQMAARLGARGAKGLQDLLPHVSPGQRPYIAAALGGAGTARAESAALEFLRNKEAGVVDAAVRSLIAQVPSFNAAHRRVLADQLLGMVNDKKQPLAGPSHAAALRLLAALDDDRAAGLFWEQLQPGHPPEARALALQTIGKQVVSPTKEQYRKLFACATESDFRVAGPALLILQHLPVNDRNLGEWVNILEASDVAARRLALQKLADRDTAELASALLKSINHPDRKFRDEVLARLGDMKQGRKLLLQALLDAGTSDEAWNLARAQSAAVRAATPKAVEPLYETLFGYLEKNDRRADAFLYLLRERDAEELKQKLHERGLHWRKKKAYEQALVYFRNLVREPASGFAIRFELACCGLKVSAKEISAEARAQDPCLHQFELLSQTSEEELVKQLEKTKWLDADDLYYVGFHLAEKEGRTKKSAAGILGMIVKRSPRTKLGQAAKTKLRSANLA